jgi:hypothetical protein
MHYFRDFLLQLANQTIVPFWVWWVSQDFLDIQLLVYIPLGCLVFYRPLSLLLMEKADETIENRDQRRYEKKWRSIYAMSPRQFRADITRREHQRDELRDAAQRLEEKALENRFSFVPKAQENMLHLASVKRAKADEIDEEIRERQSIRQRALAERAKIDGDPARVIDDIMLINSTDDEEAQEALTRLNNAPHDGRWLLELPNRVPVVDRPRVTACLRSMARAATLNEARAALYAVGRILENNKITWQEFLT